MLVVLALIFVGWAVFDYFSTRQTQVPPEDQKVVAEAREAQPDSVVRAAEALGRLAVREVADRSGYSRDRFGGDWATVSSCDMRNRILQRDLIQEVMDDDNCIVLSGVLEEGQYTGKRIEFQRGQSTSDDIQIDHVVALSDAWAKGAQDLNEPRRHEFANDPLNLLAVDGPTNMQKGNKDASEWLPRAEYRCRYIARQVAVKLKYELWVSNAEHNAMNRTLATCPDQLLPIETP